MTNLERIEMAMLTAGIRCAHEIGETELALLIAEGKRRRIREIHGIDEPEVEATEGAA